MERLATIQFLFLLLVFFFHGLCQAQDPLVVAPINKAEKEALYSVIQGFVGDWWNGSELYPDPCGWTPIQGVSCDFFDGFWYITALSIGPVLENSLECSQGAKFAPSLFNLRHLKTVSIFDCFASDHNTTIPSLNWNKLASSLQTLELRSNRGLIGGIPPELGHLTQLKSLVLVENSLSGELPRELGSLVHLKRLSLEGNKFVGHIPPSLAFNLGELLILDLSRNSLTGPLPPSLGRLTSLLKLDLSNNLLNGSLPEELGCLKNLTLLDLRSNNLSGGLSGSLQEMASLQDLLLSNNPIGGDLLKLEFEKLSNLTSLDLSNTGLSGLLPESITKLEKLSFLALDSNHLSGVFSSSKLEALSSLRALRLNSNDLSGELEFSEGFYERMGTRFASWNNPRLCYRKGMVSRENAPVGVDECRGEEEDDSVLNSKKKKVGEEENGDKNSNFIASFGLLDSSVTGFWWVMLVQDVLVMFLLIFSI